MTIKRKPSPVCHDGGLSLRFYRPLGAPTDLRRTPTLVSAWLDAGLTDTKLVAQV